MLTGYLRESLRASPRSEPPSPRAAVGERPPPRGRTGPVVPVGLPVFATALARGVDGATVPMPNVLSTRHLEHIAGRLFYAAHRPRGRPAGPRGHPDHASGSADPRYRRRLRDCPRVADREPRATRALRPTFATNLIPSRRFLPASQAPPWLAMASGPRPWRPLLLRPPTPSQPPPGLHVDGAHRRRSSRTAHERHEHDDRRKRHPRSACLPSRRGWHVRGSPDWPGTSRRPCPKSVEAHEC
jgi:hypothetical protein